MGPNGVGRGWWRVAAAVVALVVVAGLAALFVVRLSPSPAPTADGSRPLGTISGIDVAGSRTYDSRQMAFRLSYPDEWSLRETGATKETEGQYLTIAFVPRRSSGTLSPPKLEVVPDPQGFSAEAVAKMKWGTGQTTVTVTTSKVRVSGTKGVEVRASSRPGAKPLFTYEAIAVLGRRLFLMRFQTADAAEFETSAAKARRIFTSLETY